MKIFILAVCLTIVQAAPPIPRKTANNPAGARGDTQSQAKEKNKPADAPLPVDQNQSQAADGNRGNQAGKNADNPVKISELPPVTVLPAKRNWADWGYWVFSFLLVIVGALQVWLLSLQLGTINRQADIADQQRTHGTGGRAD